MSDLDTFRAEVRGWMEENVPAALRHQRMGMNTTCAGGKRWVFSSDDQRLWLERMAARGWTVPTWPKEYGGAGLTPAEERVIKEEMARVGAPAPVVNQGVWMLGPALLEYGTHEQKLEHLPKIADGSIRWAQGYSEPGAGSDLASIQTKGVEDGDTFIVNGAKIWSSFADKSDWMFALIRTEPEASKHEGISFVLLDMETPGVSTSPIKLISGESHFCQTFFDNVRVPMANVIGGRGKGWPVTRYLLQHERAAIGENTGNPLGNETLSQRALRLLGEDGIEPGLLDRIQEAELDQMALDIWLERMRDQAKARQGNPVIASGLKVFGTELSKRRSELILALEGSEGFELHSPASDGWLAWPMSTVGGGTTEIQLNIIAKRALGLPGA